MKILVISDTHGHLSNLKRILAYNHYDRIFHLGDGEGDELKISLMADAPLEIVKGNCDIFSQLSNDLILTVAGQRMMLTHGHLYNVKRGMFDLVRTAKSNEAKYVFYGHTHVPFLQEIDGVAVANPGSLSYPRGYDGSTYIEMEIDENKKIQMTLKRVEDLPE